MKMNFNGRKLLGYKINGSGRGLWPMRGALLLAKFRLVGLHCSRPLMLSM